MIELPSAILTPPTDSPAQCGMAAIAPLVIAPRWLVEWIEGLPATRQCQGSIERIAAVMPAHQQPKRPPELLA